MLQGIRSFFRRKAAQADEFKPVRYFKPGVACNLPAGERYDLEEIAVLYAKFVGGSSDKPARWREEPDGSISFFTGNCCVTKLPKSHKVRVQHTP